MRAVGGAVVPRAWVIEDVVDRVLQIDLEVLESYVIETAEAVA